MVECYSNSMITSYQGCFEEIEELGYDKATNLCMRSIYANYCKSSIGRIDMYCINSFINPYTTMHKMLECINKNSINLLRGPF